MPDIENNPDEGSPVEKKGWSLFGNKFTNIPCFKNTQLYAVGSAAGVGIAYNLLTSKPPWKWVKITYVTVVGVYWFPCRFQYRKIQQNNRKMAHSMTERKYFETPEEMQAWARNTNKSKNPDQNLVK